MILANHHGWIAAAVIGLSGCQSPRLEYPDLVERSAVYTIEDGRVVRLTSYRGEHPVLGQCVETLAYSLVADSCVRRGAAPDTEGMLSSPRIPPRMLDKQGFRAFSRMLSVESGASVEAAGQKADAKVTVAKHRLFIEWNRYTVYSLDPFTIEAEVLDDGEGPTPRSYVSGVEYGIGVRIILDVALTNVDAETNLSFGFGSVAAVVATRNAQISVQYDTIGVSRDILPKDLPMSIESVNDITRMMMGFYDAVTRISNEWNARVDRQGGRVSYAEAPMPFEAGSTKPDGAGDSIDDDVPGKAETGTPSLPANELTDLVADVQGARDFLVKHDKDAALGVLFDEKNQPIVGGTEFDSLRTKVSEDEDVSVDEVEALLDSIEQHGEALKEMKSEVRDAKLAGLPEPLRKPANVTLMLSSYYPLLHGDEDALFPRGFSAAPIAYYVTRSPENIERDYCEDLRLSYATNREEPDADARETCAKHWATEEPEEVERAFCEARLVEHASKLIGPGPLLKKKCGEYWGSALTARVLLFDR